MTSLSPTQRFSDRVANYVRYRPSYPAECLAILEKETTLSPSSFVADVGSGTGLSAELLLRSGGVVYGVEPNLEMRGAAEQFLAGQARFHSVNGTAEATTLADQSVTHVSAAQAFHWFNPEETRREFRRILKPGGWVILLWNARHLDTTPFLREYEELILRYGTDYGTVRHENINQEALERFYGKGSFTQRRVPNSQTFDLAGVTGRLLSSSYAPPPGDSRHGPMLQDLAKIFSSHEVNGKVSFDYDTQIYWGTLDP